MGEFADYDAGSGEFDNAMDVVEDFHKRYPHMPRWGLHLTRLKLGRFIFQSFETCYLATSLSLHHHNTSPPHLDASASLIPHLKRSQGGMGRQEQGTGRADTSFLHTQHTPG